VVYNPANSLGLLGSAQLVHRGTAAPSVSLSDPAEGVAPQRGVSMDRLAEGDGQEPAAKLPEGWVYRLGQSKTPLLTPPLFLEVE
jgi:hypothetical protein